MTPPEDASVTASTGNARDGSAHKNSPQSSSKDPAMNELIDELEDAIRVASNGGLLNGGHIEAIEDALSHLREGSGRSPAAKVAEIAETIAAAPPEVTARRHSTEGKFAVAREWFERRISLEDGGSIEAGVGLVSPSPDKVEEEGS